MHYDTHQIMDYLSCYLPKKKKIPNERLNVI